MSKVERLLIYPFNAEIMPLLRSKKFYKKCKNIILCALKGSGFNGKDASEADGGEFIGITISEDFEECINKCSSVLFIESQHISVKKDEIQNKIDVAQKKVRK